MEVYLVYESYYDYCNNWETLLDIYADKYKAECKVLELEELNKDELISYFIRDQSIIE